jgi:hypothetical protein
MQNGSFGVAIELFVDLFGRQEKEGGMEQLLMKRFARVVDLPDSREQVDKRKCICD